MRIVWTSTLVTRIKLAASSAEAFIYRNLTIKPFVKQTDHNETVVRWGKYKKDVERQFRFFGITDPELKKDGLLIYGGDDLIDIEDSLPDPLTQENDDAYKILRCLPTFRGKKNRFLFYLTKFKFIILSSVSKRKILKISKSRRVI